MMNRVALLAIGALLGLGAASGAGAQALPGHHVPSARTSETAQPAGPPSARQGIGAQTAPAHARANETIQPAARPSASLGAVPGPAASPVVPVRPSTAVEGRPNGRETGRFPGAERGPNGAGYARRDSEDWGGRRWDEGRRHDRHTWEDDRRRPRHGFRDDERPYREPRR